RLSPRTVTIHTIELLRYDYPRLDIDVTCGAGTYIRALARDVGEALHGGAYCSALRRTEVGPFHAEQAKAPHELDPQRHLLSPLMALESMEKIKLPADQIRRLTLGRAVELTEPSDAHELAVLDERGHLAAITSGASDGRALRPIKVFANRA
ncbi:MAG: tRNA pseudouridine(55) synthase TruB, partial [Phycisphaerae bacterium]|nr:tRNA pseudouridine(55) synthase TruB [Phycisphaerae bacterium]